MSRGLRTALILAAIVLFCCCVAGLGGTLLGTRVFGRALITNPDRVQAVGREIADYDVPSGYQELFAMNMLGVKIAAIGPAAPADFMMIMLMQLPSGLEVSQSEMERQIEQALARQTGLARADMTEVGEEEVIIKGEPVTLIVREGVTDDGEQMRQVTGLFEGKDGPALLMVAGEVDAWDPEMVDRFIASIR
jgi:hypothetical protein